MKVRDVMTTNVVSVGPDTTLQEVARLLTERRVSGAPVVRPDGTCIGVISEADLIVKERSHPVSRRGPLDWLMGDSIDPDERRRRAATQAEDAMSSPVITVEADRPLRDAADLMIERRVNRLPVVVEDRIVGIVTRADLVRAYLRVDAEIEQVIRDDILRRTMWLDPALFQVAVEEGIVDIRGRVDRRSTATILTKLIGLVDGVVAVRGALRWDLDDSKLEPSGASEREPGAASVAARDHPRPMHR